MRSGGRHDRRRELRRRRATELGGVTAWHFPLASDGRWAGHFATTAAAVEQVEAGEPAGAEYPPLPEPAFCGSTTPG
jgi:hypothetical protein